MSAIWRQDVRILGPLQNVNLYATLRSRKDIFRLFTDRATLPQSEWFDLFWRAWNRYEKRYPFLLEHSQYPTEFFDRNGELVPLVPDGFDMHAFYASSLARRLEYARGYYKARGKLLPIIIPITTYAKPGYTRENAFTSHQTIVLILPHDGYKRVTVVYIDTSAASVYGYTSVWYNEMIQPLLDVVQKAFPGTKDPVIIAQNLQGPYGSCVTFSFLLAIDIIRTPPSRWEDVVYRMQAWAKAVGPRSAARRMGTFLAHSGKVFVYLARMLLAAQKKAIKEGFQPSDKRWHELLDYKVTRDLWHSKYGAKINAALETASFVRSEALLLPDGKELRKMKRAREQAVRRLRKNPLRPPRPPRRKPQKVSASILPSARPPPLPAFSRPRPMPPPLPPFPRRT